MRLRFTLLGGALLDLDLNFGEPTDDDERLTFGFASVVGSNDINDDAKALDTSDRKAQ